MSFFKQTLLRILALVLFVFILAVIFGEAFGEGTYYCIADQLNGRAKPSRDSEVVAHYEYGWEVTLTGNHKGNWVEAVGGETGTHWVYSDYISNTLGKSRMTNTSGGRVKIRSAPEGKVVGYVKAGKSVTIERTTDGWGYIGSGWVDLSFFTEAENDGYFIMNR